VKQGLLVIISGPAGVGKSTITREVVDRCGGVFSVSMTTRYKSEQDVEGRDYLFVSRQQFERQIEAGNLLEWAEVFGNLYGTPRDKVEQAMSQGKLVVLEIDVQGAKQVKAKMPEALAIFILPPDEQTLLQRLRSRGREGEDVIQKRFEKAKWEFERAKRGEIYDRFITNADLDEAIREAEAAVRARMG